MKDIKCNSYKSKKLKRIFDNIRNKYDGNSRGSEECGVYRHTHYLISYHIRGVYCRNLTLRNGDLVKQSL